MSTDYIPYKFTNYFSNFICKYLEESPDLKTLYNRFPKLEDFKAQIEDKTTNYSNENRKVLYDVLKRQYKDTETSELTFRHIKQLKESNTFTITTGHQLNLFSGPLYFLYKIVSTINLTKELKNTYPNYNFIPVYWMASEDHDFEEINYFNFKDHKIKWHSDQQGAVGRFQLKAIEDAFQTIMSEFGNSTHAKQLQIWFKNAYLEHSNLADATRYIANKLFSDYGLVILDPDDGQLKRLFIPQIQNELFQHTAYKTVTQTNDIIAALGLKIQVNPRPINLFYITDNLRERIVLDNDIYRVNNTDITWTKETLDAHLQQYPERFSPNVIVRPLYQEVLLPNLCYIGGGGELIYWLQLKSNFEAHRVTFPMLLLRNSVLIKTEKQAKKQHRLAITNVDLFLDPQTFINKKVHEISDIKIDFSEQKQFLKQQFTSLYELAKLTDKSFLGAVKAQEIKQLRGLQHLEKRLLKAQKKQLKDKIQRSKDIQGQLFPNQSLQERYTNFSELYLEYGDAFIPHLIKELQPLRAEFTIITM